MTLRALALGVSLAALGSVAASAADLIIPTTPEPIMAAAGFDWDGIYLGAHGGGFSYGDNGAAATTSGLIGAVAGVNFIVADPILVGLEVGVDQYWNAAGNGQVYYFNLKAGAVVTDNVLLYALGGVGVDVNAGVNTGVYQLGGGVEFAVTDAITIRGEVLGLGDFTDGAGDQFFEGAQATVGLFYHF
ncbi:outer membrane immunogenic protein [Devosia lucknowensis]|uniref:Outer membrane immunogenic protein n=1 Tax=Devosia lucknowensis TaxID=1096929 RepID=A0A1Y6EPE5_9HYPH|nr:outer membrane beta-barrel protein [Devosia lucknowensis]SMQ64216.1 outer membrane immunogenic protein [Devosia lucknowensis]